MEQKFGPNNVVQQMLDEDSKAVVDEIVEASRSRKAIIMQTRCKFRLDSITTSLTSMEVGKDEFGKAVYGQKEIRTLKFYPVYSNGDPNHENSKFWRASPSGSFELGCVNLAAVDWMKVGEEYYIDITSTK